MLASLALGFGKLSAFSVSWSVTMAQHRLPSGWRPSKERREAKQEREQLETSVLRAGDACAKKAEGLSAPVAPQRGGSCPKQDEPQRVLVQAGTSCEV